MLIYLLRHADAENIVTTDTARLLTPKGAKQAEAVGAFCATLGAKPGIIITSPVRRAAQTAQIVSQHLPETPLVPDARLACGMAPETALDVLAEYRKFGAVMLVGHEPDLGLLAACLLSRDGSFVVNFRKAALCSIDAVYPGPGAGTLEFFMPVRLV